MAKYRRRKGQQATGKKKNNISLDTSLFEGLLFELEAMGGSVEKAVTDALGQAAEKIKRDTQEAVVPANMPAGGKYWTGTTYQSIVDDTTVRKEGSKLWVPVGFNFNEPGAGGFLIVGTPWVEPVPDLNKMYAQKRYMAAIHEDIYDVIMDYIIEAGRKAVS